MQNTSMTARGQHRGQTKSAGRPEGDVWEYCETPHRALRGAFAFGVIVSGLAVLITGNGIIEKILFVLLCAFMGLLMWWSLKRITCVVISRKNATLLKEKRAFFSCRSRSYSLRDFTAIVLTEHVRTGLEGYPVADYSLVLKGPVESLTILSTGDREEAVRLREELQDYLDFDAGNGASRGV